MDTSNLPASLANVKQIDRSIDEAARSLGAPLIPTMSTLIVLVVLVAVGILRLATRQ